MVAKEAVAKDHLVTDERTVESVIDADEEGLPTQATKDNTESRRENDEDRGEEEVGTVGAFTQQVKISGSSQAD